MKTIRTSIWTIAAVSAFLPFASVKATTYTPPSSNRVELNFNGDWLFKQGDISGAENQAFSDTDWRSVGLPHTTKFVSPEDPQADLGVSWYRKHFSVDSAHSGKKVFIEFGAAMQSASVYLNGSLVTQHVGGYTPFMIDVSSLVSYGGTTNVLAVRTDNRHSTDWAPGQSFVDFQYHGGLYRNVRMIVTDPVHVTDAVYANQIAGGGVFVTYPSVSTNSATVNVKTHVTNESGASGTWSVVSTLTDSSGTVVQTSSNAVAITSGSSHSYNQDLIVATPQLWHPQTPTLYHLHTEVRNGATTMDYVKTRIGIRHIEWTHSEGLKINGTRFKARGANFHQEIYGQACAMPDRTAYYDIKRFKEAGFDYVRSAHYPHSPAFYDACDELGVLVMNSLTGWQYYNDSTAFKNNTYQECRDMIRRDRNHPSIIVWETSLNEANFTDTWAQTIHDIAHAEYPGNQMYTIGWKTSIFDVYGGASQHHIRDNTTETRPMIITEYGDWDYGGNTSSSRVAREADDNSLLVQCNNHQESLDANLALSWFSVDGLWQFADSTGYLNTTTKCGVMDHYRLPKFSYYFFQSQRDADVVIPGVSTGPMAYIANTWKAASSPSTVRVFSNCEQVSLYLNGSLVETRSPDASYPDLPHPPFTFNLGSYTAGTIRADGLIGGSMVASHSRTTPGTPTQIALAPEGTEVLVADGGDARLVFISVLDASSNVVADATTTVNLSISGNGQIVGPTTVQMKAGQLATWVRAGRLAGSMTLTASGTGLTSAMVTLTSDAVPGIGPLPAPSVPTGLGQSGSGPATELDWTDASGVWNYNVKRSSTQGGPYTTITTVPNTQYGDTTALVGSNYYYVVSAVNEAGLESADSAEAIVSVADIMENLSFELDETGSQIASKIDTGFDVPGTDVAGWRDAGGVNSDSGVDYLGNGGVTTHDGTVLAYCASADPGAYQIASYILQDGDQIFLTWWAKSSWNNAGQQVQLLSAASPTSTFGSLTALTNSTAALADVGNGGAFTQYSLDYTATAADAGKYLAVSFRATGSSAWAMFDDMDLSLVVGPSSPPAKPAGLNAIGDNGQVELSWSSVVAADSYSLYRSEIPGGFDTLVSSGIVANVYTDTGVANGTTYYYAVIAVNAAGTSDFSDQVSATPVRRETTVLIDNTTANGSFEVPGAAKVFFVNGDIPHWANWAEQDTADDDTGTDSASGGTHNGLDGARVAFIQPGGAIVNMVTNAPHTIQEGDVIDYSCWNSLVGRTEATLSLVYDNSGILTQISGTSIAMADGAQGRGQLVVQSGDAWIGKTLGLGIESTAAGWPEVDQATLSVSSILPDPLPANIAIIISGASVSLSSTNLSAEAGVTNFLQFKANLVDGTWSNLLSITGIVETNWAFPTTSTQGFYRVETTY